MSNPTVRTRIRMSRILFLSNPGTIILDILSWIIFHLSIGYWSSKISIEKFDPDRWYYRSHPWEKNGEIYQKLFRVKDWKRYIPSGAAVYKGAYEIKHLGETTIENLRLWIKESCRSEFCHIMMILPGFSFFLWNDIATGWWMVAYAFANNLVPIIMQRYNRPRVQKLLKKMDSSLIVNGNTRMTYEPKEILYHIN